MVSGSLLDFMAVLALLGWLFAAWRGLGALADSMKLTRGQVLLTLGFMGWLFSL